MVNFTIGFYTQSLLDTQGALVDQSEFRKYVNVIDCGAAVCPHDADSKSGKCLLLVSDGQSFDLSSWLARPWVVGLGLWPSVVLPGTVFSNDQYYKWGQRQLLK